MLPIIAIWEGGLLDPEAPILQTQIFGVYQQLDHSVV